MKVILNEPKIFTKISIVICTYSFERYNDTLETITSLCDQTYDNIEIILIVDRNEKLHHEYSLLETFKNSDEKIKLGLSKLSGLSNARNKGISLSTGEIIAFIDDDAIADKFWIETLISSYNSENIISVGGPMRPYWLSGEAAWIPEEFYWTIGCSYKSQKMEPQFVRSNFGSNMSFRKTVFSFIGYFDENYGLNGNNKKTGEETELSIRALTAIPNSKILFVPDAVVYHKIFSFRKKPLFLIRRCYEYGYAVSSFNISQNCGDELNSVEDSFIDYIIKKSIPYRMKSMFRRKNIILNFLQLSLIFIFCLSVFYGYFIGKVNDISKKFKKCFKKSK